MFSLSKALDFVKALKNQKPISCGNLKTYCFLYTIFRQKQVSSENLATSSLLRDTILLSVSIGAISGLAFHSIGTAFQIANHQILWNEYSGWICYAISYSVGLLNGLLVAILKPIYFFLLRNAFHHRHLITLISGIFGLIAGIISFRMLLPISSFTLGLYLLFGGLEGVLFGLTMAGITHIITQRYKYIWETSQHKGKTLPAIGKPSYSKIQLRKASDSLKILLPARKIDESTIFMPPLIIQQVIEIFWIREKYGIKWAIREDIFEEVFFLYLFMSLTFILFYLYLTFMQCKRVRIHISAQQISLTNELWGRSLNRFSLERKDISELKLFYSQHEWRLIIEAGKHKYELNKITPLNQAEVDWLAYELRDWLTESGWVVQFDFNYLPLQVL